MVTRPAQMEEPLQPREPTVSIILPSKLFQNPKASASVFWAVWESCPAGLRGARNKDLLSPSSERSFNCALFLFPKRNFLRKALRGKKCFGSWLTHQFHLVPTSFSERM